MSEQDKITIERWELEDIIETFRVLTTTIPKIKERGSCLDRLIMKSYARLVYLYNGEEFDHHAFCEYYMGKKEIPELKKEEEISEVKAGRRFGKTNSICIIDGKPVLTGSKGEMKLED